MSAAKVTVERSKRFLKRSTIIPFLFVAGLGLYAFLFSLSRKSSEKPILVLDSRLLTFGDIWENNAVSRELRIHNPTNEAVEIVRFDHSCDCTVVRPDRLTIPPGQTGEITLELNLEGGFRPGSLHRDFVVQVSPVTKSGRRIVWKLTGRALRPLAVSTETLTYAEPLYRGGPFPAKSISVSVPVGVSDIRTEYDETFLDLEIVRNPQQKLLVMLKENAPVGAFKLNTVRQVITTVSAKVFFKGGR